MLVFILLWSLIPAQILDIIYNSVLRNLFFTSFIEINFTTFWGFVILFLLVRELFLFLIKRKNYINIYKRNIKIEKK